MQAQIFEMLIILARLKRKVTGMAVKEFSQVCVFPMLN